MFTGTIVQPGDILRCIDTQGLELDLIKKGELYMVTGVFRAPPKCIHRKFKGYPADNELCVSLLGIHRVVKPNGRGEGETFNLRRFMVAACQ